MTDEINTLYGQKNACNRIISTYNKVYEEVQKEIVEKEKAQELIKNHSQSKNKSL